MMDRVKPVPGSPDTTDEAGLRELRRSLDLDPTSLPIEDLFPIFVPSSFFESGWHGPFELLKIDGLALTWILERPSNTMLYVSHTTADHWESQGIDWQERALRNLDARPGRFTTHHFNREGDGTLYAAVFMNEDGFGPSRLLLGDRLRTLFPNGYRVALPEMSCGIALAADALAEESGRILDLTQKCFADGTRPLVAGIHQPAQLTRDPMRA